MLLRILSYLVSFPTSLKTKGVRLELGDSQTLSHESRRLHGPQWLVTCVGRAGPAPHSPPLLAMIYVLKKPKNIPELFLISYSQIILMKCLK